MKFRGYMTDYECSLEIKCTLTEMMRASGSGEHRYNYPADWKGWDGPGFVPHPSVVGTPAEYSPNVDVMQEAEARRFIEHTKQGLIHLRAHETEGKKRRAALEKTYGYKMFYAVNHHKKIPLPVKDGDFSYYIQEFGDGGPHADAVADYRNKKRSSEALKAIEIRIVNAKRNLKACREILATTRSHIEKNKDAWGISDEQEKALIDHDAGNVSKYQEELAVAMDELTFLQGAGQSSNIRANVSSGGAAREKKVKDGFNTYTGAINKKTKAPKLKPFRAHVSIPDLKRRELKQWWQDTH